MRRRLCLAVVLCAAAAPIFAGQITGVYVVGLRRTQPRVIETPLQRFIGLEASDVDTNEVHAIVGNLGVLEPLAVEILYSEDGNGKILAVTVRERWSILGMPFFTVSSRGWLVGGGVADTNAFGLRNMLALAGAYGSNEWFAMAMFMAMPNAVGDFGLMLAAPFGLATTEHTDQTGATVLRRFDMIRISPVFGLSYSLTERLTPGIRFSYNFISVRDSEDSVGAPVDGIRSFSVSPNIEVRHGAWDGYLRSENFVSLEYYYAVVFGNDNVHRVSLRVAYNRTIVPGFRATARGGFVFSTRSATPFFESGPVFGINILSSSYSARDYAGLSLGLERHLFRFPQGTVSVAVAYQGVFSYGSLMWGNQFDHGPAATLQLYFNRLAVPGIGLGGAYNVARNSFQFAFNIGMFF
ncbi:MAG: hypothetical protein FWB79_00175 [Treponema sp.]|nr:hypothetical protein [Treponema sp.]